VAVGVLGGAAGYAWYLATSRVVPAAGGTYTEAIVGRVGLLNPLFAEGDENVRDLGSLVFEGLTRVEPGGEIGGALAQDWETSADQRTYRFRLRSGVRWADGEPLRPEDILFTIRLVQDPDYNGTVLAGNWRKAQAVAEDAEHVRVTLPAPSAAFLANVALLPILPQHVFGSASLAETKSHPFNLRPFGTGPFRVAGRSDDAITFERSRTSRRVPLLDQITLRSFATEPEAVAAVERGQVDGLAQAPEHVFVHKPASAIRVYSAQTYEYASLLFNLKPDVPFFQDRRVRKAIGLAINRPRLIREVLRGRGTRAEGPIPAAIAWAVNPRVPDTPYDPTAARRLLTEAGWPDPAGTVRKNSRGEPFRVSLVVERDRAMLAATAARIAEDLRQVGIEVDTRAVDPAAFVRRYLQPRTFELALAAFDNGPDPDVSLFWHSSAVSAGGLNFVSMRRNIFIDRDLEEGRATTDRAARQAAYYDFQRLLADEAPAVFLFSPQFTYVINRRVQGVALNPALQSFDRFQYVERWYVMTRRVRAELFGQR